MTTIIAIGGEEIGKLLSNGNVKPIVMERIHKEIIARTGKKHPRVLYIPTAKNDSEEYVAGFSQYYLSLGCGEVNVLRLLYEHPTKEEIAEKIFSADAIYVNGGNAHRAYRAWRRYGVDKMLIQAHQQGIVMSGHSAGCIAWFQYGCSDSFGKKQPFRLSALGIINAVVCPHYDSEPVRQPALKKIMKRTSGLVALAVDEYAAIELVDDNYRILIGEPYAKVRKAYWKQNEYVVIELKSADSYQKLLPLLQKS